MGGRIPAEAIQRIRERASLIEVVSDVVTLRKRGRTVVGLCPFHTEKTPSFTVSEERGFYHCFGCGEHGDVFGFVMKTQSLAFPEAIRAVAQRFGLPVPEGSESERRGGEPAARRQRGRGGVLHADPRGARRCARPRLPRGARRRRRDRGALPPGQCAGHRRCARPPPPCRGARGRACVDARPRLPS